MKKMFRSTSRIFLSIALIIGCATFVQARLDVPVVFFVFAGEVKETEKDIEKIEEKIEDEEKEVSGLKTNLANIQSNLYATREDIQETEEIIETVDETIARKEKKIEDLVQKLDTQKSSLANLVRQRYYFSQIPMVEVVVKRDTFSALLHGKDHAQKFQEEVKILTQETILTQKKIKEEKMVVEEEKEEKEEFLALKEVQEKNLISRHGLTEEELQEKEATISELKEKLADLQSDLRALTGDSYDAGDIREAVEFASGKTGVPRGVLYGFLKMETNLGANTGQCTYKQVKKDAIDLWYGKSSKWKGSRELMENRYDIFKSIVKELGYSKEKKVSCTPRSYRGQGGAMGVSQFMADVWRWYESDIQVKTGHKNPDPWNLTDGVMAMALKLRKAGTTSDSKSAIKSASIQYLGAFNQGYYDGIVYWSKNYKNLFK